MPATRRGKRWRSWTAAAAAVLIGCSPTEPELDGGLVANGGFEQESEALHPVIGSRPEHWSATVSAGPTEFHTFALDSETARSGRHSVRIGVHPDHPTDGDVYWYRWVQEITDGFELGRSYRFEAWGRTSGVTRTDLVFIEVRLYDREDAQIGREWGFVPGSGADPLAWQRVAFSFDVPAETWYMRINAGIVAPHNAGGTVWFDDFSVLPVGG